MSLVPKNLKYLKSHEWIRFEEDDTLTIGITDYAQEMLGDLVYVELPEAGQALDAEEGCVVLESVKTASDVYSPVTGKVLAVNETLNDTPEAVNQSPYGDGWLFKLKADGKVDPNDFLDAKAYKAAVAEEAEEAEKS
ncbi:MAG: glycine cleavage system protein GcvH [Gammaproteobacteria bacterium]|nr:glycine cleavage system protein GcvH [Gammaproteobacteria bacterium]